MSPSNVGVHDKWSSASLRIFGEKLRPEQIDAMLGLKATHIHLKGQRRSPRHKAVWRESLWSLRSRLSDDHSIADHLEWLLERLEPKADVIKTLSANITLTFSVASPPIVGRAVSSLTASHLNALRSSACLS